MPVCNIHYVDSETGKEEESFEFCKKDTEDGVRAGAEKYMRLLAAKIVKIRRLAIEEWEVKYARS